MWSQLQTYFHKIMYDLITWCLSFFRELKRTFFITATWCYHVSQLHHHVSSLVDVRYCGVCCIQEHVFHCPSLYWQTTGGVLGFQPPPTNQRSEHSNFNCCLLKWGKQLHSEPEPGAQVSVSISNSTHWRHTFTQIQPAVYTASYFLFV